MKFDIIQIYCLSLCCSSLCLQEDSVIKAQFAFRHATERKCQASHENYNKQHHWSSLSPPSHSLGNIEMEKLHTSNMCASSMHQQHQNGWADHCYWPECWHSPLHQGIPTQQETTLCLEVKILLFARIVSIIIPLSANVQTRPTIMILESLALTMLQTSGMSPVDYHRAHCETCLILLILDAFHSPWDCIRDSHWRADSYLHSVCICFDELAKNLGFCVLRISKVHHLIKQFILQWTASKQIFKWQWCWHRIETIFW